MTYYDIDDVSVSIDDIARPPALPFSDDHTRALIDQAVASLISLRLPLSHGDAAAELHALASIVAEAQARLPYAATDARDQDHSWAEIATCLGVSPAAARRRFAGAATTGRPWTPTETSPLNKSRSRLARSPPAVHERKEYRQEQ